MKDPEDQETLLKQPAVSISSPVTVPGHSSLASPAGAAAGLRGSGRSRRFMDLRVEMIHRIMQDNLHRTLSLGELASAVNLSVWRLCHVFRSEAAMSPIQYLRFLRMERARYLLETSFLSVVEITHAVGVNDLSHFVRDFKKAYGATPTFYRTLFKEAELDESITVELHREPEWSGYVRSGLQGAELSLPQ